MKHFLLPLLCSIATALLVSCSKTPELPTLVGKKLTDPEVREFLTTLPKQPEISTFDFDDRYFYSFKDLGFSMCFQKDHTVSSVFLYTNGTDGFSAYKGKVPYGLSLDDTRRQVEARLGPPAKTGGAPIINFWVDYPSKFLGITYATKSSEDFEARIATLSLNIR